MMEMNHGVEGNWKSRWEKCFIPSSTSLLTNETWTSLLESTKKEEEEDAMKEKEREERMKEKGQQASDFYQELMGSSISPSISPSISTSISPSSFFCWICEETITASSPSSHRHSTLHLINISSKSSVTQQPRRWWCTLPETNRGLKLMQQTMGWSEAAAPGLGKNSQGILDPPKTTLKNDRLGLGHPATKQLCPPKVTHFGPGDLRAVMDPTKRREVEAGKKGKRQEIEGGIKKRTGSKVRNERKEMQRKEKGKEARIRQELYCNDDVLHKLRQC